MGKDKLKEKIAFLSGKDTWSTKPYNGLESVTMSDGPHGLRKTIGSGDNLGIASSEPATCFPTASVVAPSFDESLAYLMAKYIGKEAGSKKVSTILGPGVNIKRNPLCGRNFEYYSEDPYLSGKMASGYIKGAKSEGIATSLKHFLCNSQEYYRMVSDSMVDLKTLNEIYLKAFEIAVKEAQPETIMCSYNRINGVWASDSKYFLTDVLRKQWGFNGIVVTDWGAINDRTEAIKAGCDLVMPGGSAWGEADAVKAIKEGKLSEADVDRCVDRLSTFVKDRIDSINSHSYKVDYDKADEVALKIAKESMVLMKNNDKILPLKDTDSWCIIGDMADKLRFQGAGSSKINAIKTPSLAKLCSDIAFEKGYDLEKGRDDSLLDSAVTLAKSNDKVVIVLGLTETDEAEGIDRRNMCLKEYMDELVERVSEVNDNIVAVIVSGAPCELPWIDKVKGVLWAGLAGQASDRAIFDLITGETSPSGRLAETWPVKYSDVITSDTYLKTIDQAYSEGIYVGYRFYDKVGIKPLFGFGHGLSYMDVSYDNIRLEGDKVSIDVINRSDVSGKVSVLMYIMPPIDATCRPVKELKAFCKVDLKANETKTVSFDISDDMFKCYVDGWKILKGRYKIMIENLTVDIDVDGEVEPDNIVDPYYEFITDRSSHERYLYPSNVKRESANLTVKESSEGNLVLKLVYNWFEHLQAKKSGRGSVEYISAMVSANECPLRAVQNLLQTKLPIAKILSSRK